MRENIILNKTFHFALALIKYCELLHAEKKLKTIPTAAC